MKMKSINLKKIMKTNYLSRAMSINKKKKSLLKNMKRE